MADYRVVPSLVPAILFSFIVLGTEDIRLPFPGSRGDCPEIDSQYRAVSFVFQKSAPRIPPSFCYLEQQNVIHRLLLSVKSAALALSLLHNALCLCSCWYSFQDKSEHDLIIGCFATQSMQTGPVGRVGHRGPVR